MNVNDVFGIKEEVDESYLLQLKEKVRLLEKKLKENNKPKTITISGKTHGVIKKYCTSLNYNIGEWVEKVLLKEIEDSKCAYYVKDYDPTDDKIKETVERWVDSKDIKGTLVKSNKYMLSDLFSFRGYSRSDGSPIYEFLGDFNSARTSIEYIKSSSDKFSDLDIKIVSKEELSKSIETHKKLECIILNSKEL